MIVDSTNASNPLNFLMCKDDESSKSTVVPSFIAHGFYIPDEIVKIIVNNIGYYDSLVCNFVSQNLHQLVIKKFLIFKFFGFSPLSWNLSNHKVLLDEVDKAYLELPDILNKLKSPSPLNKEKIRAETDVLFYIPDLIQEKDVTINNIQVIFPFKFIWFVISNIIGNTKVKPGWVLMAKDVLEATIGKSYAVQKEQIDALNLEFGNLFQVPKTAVAIIGIWAEFLKTGTRLFQSMNTRCEEGVGENSYTVGYFGKDGPVINFQPDCSGNGMLYVEYL